MLEKTITIERLYSYSPQDAIYIGKLLPLLSSRFTDAPASEGLLKEIIGSPYHDLIVARDDSGEITGMAVLNLTIGIGDGHEALLEQLAGSVPASDLSPQKTVRM